MQAVDILPGSSFDINLLVWRSVFVVHLQGTTSSGNQLIVLLRCFSMFFKAVANSGTQTTCNYETSAGFDFFHPFEAFPLAVGFNGCSPQVTSFERGGSINANRTSGSPFSGVNPAKRCFQLAY